MWQVLYNRNQAPAGADKCGKLNHQAVNRLWKTLLAQGKHYWALFCFLPAGQEKHLCDGHLRSFSPTQGCQKGTKCSAQRQQ